MEIVIGIKDHGNKIVGEDVIPVRQVCTDLIGVRIKAANADIEVVVIEQDRHLRALRGFGILTG